MPISSFNARIPVILLLALLILPGCSQHFKDISDTVRVGALGYKDVPLSREKIAALPYAAIQLKWGSSPRVLSVLTFAEGDELKWLTQDKKMIVTRHGRLVKSVGYPQDLRYVGNIDADPLPNLLTLWRQSNIEGMRWGSERDWQPGYYSGYATLSRFSYAGEETVSILNSPVRLLKFTEQVRYPKQAVEYVNTFWLSPTSGEVIKSVQFMGPGLPEVEITLVKPYQSWVKNGLLFFR